MLSAQPTAFPDDRVWLLVTVLDGSETMYDGWLVVTVLDGSKAMFDGWLF